MRKNNTEKMSETESDKHQGPEAKITIVNLARQKSKAKKPPTISVKSGELWIKKANQTDLSVPKCQNICSQARPVKAQETGDEETNIST